MTRLKVDWFPIAMVSSLALLVIWALLFWARITHAGDMTVTWQPPTTHCDGSPLTVERYEVRWGQGSGQLQPTATEFMATGLKPGVWWVSVAAVNPEGVEGQFASASKTVAPEDFKTTSTVVYTFVKAENRVTVLPTSHTVPLGVQCDATQSVNGKYVIQRSAVEWASINRPVVVLADCG